MSGTVIITKFSDTASAPITNALVKAEQAYSYSSNKLWIGKLTGGNVTPVAIGGVFFTDQLKSASSLFGQVTANQALVTGADNKLDLINIDNITIDGNTITTTNTNGTLIVDPNGTGSISLHANTDIVGNVTISGTATLNGQTLLASVNVTDLTDTRLIFAGASGELMDSANLTWASNTLVINGAATVDNVRVDGNTISATNTNGSLTLTPAGTGTVVVNSTTGLIVPSGLLGTRPTALALGNAAIRYNETSNRFEGTVAGAWTGLGGIVDIDQDTYITAEQSTDEDKLRFYTGGTQELYIDATGLYVTDQITTPIANTTTGNVGTLNVSTQLQVNADANFTVGIDVTAGDVDITDNLNVAGNTVIGGNLTVNGTTTSVNSTVTTLNDPVIKVGDGSTIAADLIDRGVNFDYGDDVAVKTGFFGFDNATSRFSFKPIVNTADEDYVAPWGDAQFGNLFLSGDATVHDNLVLSANGIVTVAGDLTIAPAGGDTFITGTATVSTDLLVQGNVTFDNDVPVTSGGTGMSSFTGNGVMVANVAGTAMTFVTGTQYDLVQFNASGVPIASNTIDGGTF